MYNFVKAATVAAAVLVGGAAQAATVEINSISAEWVNVNPNTGISNFGNVLLWGNGGQQSGYVFDATMPGPVASNPFLLGDFTHNNFPITGATLSSADLKLSVNVTVVSDSGVAQTVDLAPTYTVNHNETPNTASTCSGDSVPCDDIVTFGNIWDGSATVTVDGVEYSFVLAGFSQDGGATLVDAFRTIEGQSNTAGLWASFSTAPVSAVPLPAAGFMLLGAMGGLGALRLRRKAA
ncbi:MAG: THxN family PEP-CTERM protein [Pikeienuella sp.]